MSTGGVFAALQSIKCRFMVIGMDSDLLYPLHEQEEVSAVPCCAVLCCAVLYCTVLFCTVLYCTVLYCTVLYGTVLYVLHRIYFVSFRS